ncbi:MAG: hypothetical protein HQL75_00445 [Magnetococcales bacterium]|nr:hypothetical protein [Magnetococcales bacterium]
MQEQILTGESRGEKSNPGAIRKTGKAGRPQHGRKPMPKPLPKNGGAEVGYIPAPGPGGREYKLTVEATDGQIKQKRRIQDVLEILYRKGKINHAQYNAGRQFQDHFTIAMLDQISAVDLNRAPTGHERNWDLVEMAQKHVSRTMDYLGGVDSPAGHAVWHILGLGDQLEKYTNSRNVIDYHFTFGVLSAALGMLGKRYPIHSTEAFK